MRKMLLLLLSLTLLLTLAACGAEPAVDEPAADAEAAGEAAEEISCTVEISYANAVSAPDFPLEAIVTECADGVLVNDVFTFAADTTAEAALVSVLQEQGLSFSETGVYFTAVNGLEAGACGELSGWMYSVNGECPTLSAAEYELADGDLLQLQYTLDMGADLGFSFE